MRGRCPVHKVGGKITADDPEIILEKTDARCTHALSSLLHYVPVLEQVADPVDLGLSKPEDREHAYIQCVEPCESYTSGRTVIFKIRKVRRVMESQKNTRTEQERNSKMRISIILGTRPEIIKKLCLRVLENQKVTREL